MNVHHALFFCFLSALCGGNTRLVRAKVNIYIGAEGETGSLYFGLHPTGNKKFFCRNKCKAEDILIQTVAVSAQNGRYSIEYRNSSTGFGILTFKITDMIKSDSGRYRCGLGKTLFPDSFSDIEVKVSDAPLLAGAHGLTRTETEGEDIKYPCSNSVHGIGSQHRARSQKFVCKDKCKEQEDILVATDGTRAQSGRYSIEYTERSAFGLYVTIKRVTKADTGWYRCGYGRALSPVFYRTIGIVVIDAPTTSTPTSTQSLSFRSGSFPPSSVHPETTDQPTVFLFPLVVCVLVVVVLSAVVVLLLYKHKTNRNSGGRDMECVTHENCPPASTCEDSNIYQSLDPASRVQD